MDVLTWADFSWKLPAGESIHTCMAVLQIQFSDTRLPAATGNQEY